MFRYAMLVAAVVVGAVALGGESPDNYTVRVVGLQVAAPVGGDERVLWPFNSWGTVVSAMIEAKGPKNIISSDLQNSKLTAMRDDKGTDLKKQMPEAAKRTFGGAAVGPSPVSKDGKSLLVQMHAQGIPAKGSTRVEAEATVPLFVASQKKTDKQAGVALKLDTVVQTGAGPLKIVKVNTPGESVDVRFQGKEPIFQQITAIKFFRDGKEVKSMLAFAMPPYQGTDGWVASRQYKIEPKLDTVDMEIEYWADMEKVEVPVKVQAGVGL